MDQQHQIIRLQLEIKALKEQLQYKEEKLEQLQYQNVSYFNEVIPYYNSSLLET